MKTYEKPVMEKVNSQVESLLVGISNTMGAGEQLAKKQIDLFLDDDFSADEENL